MARVRALARALAWLALAGALAPCTFDYARYRTRAGIDPPRPLAPLATTTVTSSRPTLRWELAPGTDGAMVELCLDRDCTRPAARPFEASGTSGRPDADLPRGVVYWRLRGRANGRFGAAPNATVWYFVVRRSPTSADPVPPADTSFGVRLDVNGDGVPDVAATAPNAEHSVRVFMGTGSAAQPLPDLAGATTLSVRTAPNFGSGLAAVGDVNGDGYGDLAVSSVNVLSSPTPGAVYVFHGSPTGLPATPSAVVPAPPPSGGGSTAINFGFALAAAGDVNGDGYADVLAGAPNEGTRGAAYVLLGSASGLQPPSTRLAPTTSDATATRFGVEVGASDVNGDGWTDVWGAYENTTTGPMGPTTGASVQVFLGTQGGGGLDATGVELPHAVVVLGGQTPEFVPVGDVNGDGCGDALLSTYSAATPLLFLGSRRTADGAGGFTPQSVTVIPAGCCGHGARGAGDVDGDGYDDVLINPRYRLPPSVVYFGSANGVNPAAPHLELGVPGGTQPPSFGDAAVIPGDLDGDGRADVVVAAPTNTSDPPSSPGKLFVYLGAPQPGSGTATLLPTAPTDGITGAPSSHLGADLAWLEPGAARGRYSPCLRSSW